MNKTLNYYHKYFYSLVRHVGGNTMKKEGGVHDGRKEETREEGLTLRTEKAANKRNQRSVDHSFARLVNIHLLAFCLSTLLTPNLFLQKNSPPACRCLRYV